MLEASIELAPDLALVGVARRFVDQMVTRWGLHDIRDDALLITSELSANAVRHARTAFQVKLQSDGSGHLRIEVRDNSDQMPTHGLLQQDMTGGRGLAIVAALATSWEAEVESAGKVVRAEIHRGCLPSAGDGLLPKGLAR